MLYVAGDDGDAEWRDWWMVKKKPSLSHAEGQSKFEHASADAIAIFDNPKSSPIQVSKKPPLHSQIICGSSGFPSHPKVLFRSFPAPDHRGPM